MSRVVAMGEILWDEFPGQRRLGGAPANFAWHAHGLGLDARMVSRVGNDADGQAILARLRTMGMDVTALSIDPVYPTGRVLVHLDASGQPQYDIVEGVAWDHLAATPDVLALAARADVFCYGTLAQRHPAARAGVTRALGETPTACRRVFDINLRQHYYSADVLLDSLNMATIVKLNDEELPTVMALLGLSADTRPLQTLREHFDLELVALTRGSRGSVLVGVESENEHPGIAVTVADTVGAGDAFTAALCAGLERDWPLEHTHDFANRVAAFVCSQPGATPDVPSRFREELGASSST